MAEWGRGPSAGAAEDVLDVENKRMADSLASKVTRLKTLALDIDKDAEEQNRYLDGMVRNHQHVESDHCVLAFSEQQLQVNRQSQIPAPGLANQECN